MEIFCDSKNKSRLISELVKIDENILVITTYNQKKIVIQATMDEKQLWDIKHYLKKLQAEKIML